MAEGARRLCECDVALADHRHRRPDRRHRDEAGRPRATGPSRTRAAPIVRDRVFAGDRDEVQLAAAYAGLDLLRRIGRGAPRAVTPPLGR